MSLSLLHSIRSLLKRNFRSCIGSYLESKNTFSKYTNETFPTELLSSSVWLEIVDEHLQNDTKVLRRLYHGVPVKSSNYNTIQTLTGVVPRIAA